MFAFITHTINFLAMAVSLWMAFHLFARGFPNRVTLRAALALLAISTFFLDTYNHFFDPHNQTANLRAALLVIAFTCWYSATYTLLTPEQQKRFRRIERFVYALATAAVIALIVAGSGFARSEENLYHTARLEWNAATFLYGSAQLTASVGVIFNLFIRQRIRNTGEGKFLFVASWFLIFALGYGIVALSIPASLPRVVEDGLVFGGIFFLGVSVARHQSLVERRTIWQDFPVAFLGMITITALYLTIAVAAGAPASLLGNIAALVIATHAMHDIGREAVERWRIQDEKRLRRRANQTETLEDEAMRLRLDAELALLLEALNASSGLIASREDGNLIITATHESLPLGSMIPDGLSNNEGITRMEKPSTGLEWVSQTFEGMEPVALVGIGPSRVKLEYSSGELELLEEFTEQIGTLISINSLQKQVIQSAAIRVTESLSSNVRSELLKSVEDALRHFGDTLYLGQSPLADETTHPEQAHIERGKQLQRVLREAVESLRPEGDRPPEPLPREWYNYVVLYDAYIKGTPNREVIARLYVSEGTFHRTRRQAVRGVARWLVERRRNTNGQS